MHWSSIRKTQHLDSIALGWRHFRAIRRRLRERRHFRHRLERKFVHGIDLRARRGRFHVHTPGKQSGPRQVRQGHRPIHERGPNIPLPLRQRQQAVDRLGHGRIASRNLCPANGARVQLPGGAWKAESCVPGNTRRAVRIQLLAQETERRRRPIRARHWHNGASSSAREHNGQVQ